MHPDVRALCDLIMAPRGPQNPHQPQSTTKVCTARCACCEWRCMRKLGHCSVCLGLAGEQLSLNASRRDHA